MKKTKTAPDKKKSIKVISKKKPAEKAKTSINPAEQDFGGIKKRNSSTESRKNVNADPNLIQSNELEDEDNTNTSHG